jgi:hypothetical protein
MILCIQCAMEAMLTGTPYRGEPDADEVAHLKRVHPDPQVTQARRKEMERLLATHLALGKEILDLAQDEPNDPSDRARS